RPRTAAAVGRILAERLGVRLDARELVDELRWPVAFGRDGWVSEWMEAVEAQDRALWIRVPEREEPRPFWEHLRLFASLRGKNVRGVDLGAELREVTNGVALDEWCARLVTEGANWIAALVPELAPWQSRALESLERACALERAKRAAVWPRLF